MSDDIKYLVKNLTILGGVFVLTYFSSAYFGIFYEYFFPQSIGGSGLFSIPHKAGLYLIGLPLAYTFFLTSLLTAFGGTKKYWWIGGLLLPAVAFEVYFDLSHIYFPIALGLAGWLLGFLVCKLKIVLNRG